MTQQPLDVAIEQELRSLSASLTQPFHDECLLCYVARMLTQFGCRCTLRFALRYRDLQAPRATALDVRLGRRGAFCDCEIFLNAYELHPRLLPESPTEPFDVDDDGAWVEVDAAADVPLPECAGVRRGSTQGCCHWVPIRRRGW